MYNYTVKNIHPIALLSVFLNLILIVLLAIIVRSYPYVLFETKQARIERLPKADADKLFALVQNWRTENGYKQYIEDEVLCGYAYQRAHEITRDFSHRLFDPNKYISNASYTFVSENIVMYISDQNDKEIGMLGWWLNSPKHLEALKADYPNSCIACYNDHCVQLFANFQGTKNTPPIQ